MSLFPVRVMKIQSKMKALECSQHFTRYKSMGIFSDRQGQVAPQCIIIIIIIIIILIIIIIIIIRFLRL